MTEYVFDANSSMVAQNWDDPGAWYGGVVPNGPDAQVSIPTVTYADSGDVYASDVAVQSGESFAVQSVTLANNDLTLIGNLSISGALDIQTGGEIDLAGATLTFGSLINDGLDIQGYGVLETAGFMDNTGKIYGGGGSNGLTIDATVFRNTGTILASAPRIATTATTVTVNAGSDLDFAGGTLGGSGTYEASDGGILDLNLGGAITIDAATIVLQDHSGNDLTGQIDSFDVASGTYQALQTTLTTVAGQGRLVVDGANYATAIQFDVAGELTLRASNNVPGSFTAPSLTIAAGGTVDGVGTVAAPIVSDGVIVSETSAADDPSAGPQPGDLILDGPVTGTGTLEVGVGLVTDMIGIQPPTPVVERSYLELGGATALPVLFLDGTGNLVLDDPTSFSGVVTTQGPTADGGFADLITLDGIPFPDVTSYSYAGDGNGGTLTIVEGQTAQTLRFAGSHQTSDFTLGAGPQALSNASPNLDVSIACYARGTLIRTDCGNVAVEALRIGDRVATFGGASRPIRWIGRRGYGGRFLAANPGVQPILFKAGSLGRYQPSRDLRVSPKHAMFLHGCLVPADCLVDGTSIVVDAACDDVEYFHVELDSHDILLAEDTPSESFVDDASRAMFHNAHEFAALYPEPPNGNATYCAPRIEDGERLEQIRRALGLEAAAGGALHGRLDEARDRFLRGWAQDADRPEVPVCLEILADGAVVGRTMANLFRADLAEAGLGSGRHGFGFAMSAGIDGATLEVRRAGDHATLGIAKLGIAKRRRQAA